METGHPIRPGEMWVNFSDGRTLPGEIRWAQGDPVFLAIVSVDTDQSPGQIQFSSRGRSSDSRTLGARNSKSFAGMDAGKRNCSQLVPVDAQTLAGTPL